MPRPLTMRRSVVAIEHKQMRVILNPSRSKAEIPPDVEREQRTIDWAEALYLSAMRLAAGVLVEDDSLEKAARALCWAGFEVPAGYFPPDEEDEFADPGSKKALRAFVERDEENIRRAFGSIGFYLAGTGALMDPKEKYLASE